VPNPARPPESRLVPTDPTITNQTSPHYAEDLGPTMVFLWGGAVVRIVAVSLDPTRAAAVSTSEDRSSGASGRAVQQAPGLWRTDLQRQDLSVPGARGRPVARGHRPGSAVGQAHHPGEEIIYILEGSLEYQIEGQPPKTFNAGDALTVPAGAIDVVRNVGSLQGGRHGVPARLPGGTVHAAPDDWLRRDGFPRRSGRLDAGPRPGQL
jgi:mannose-6-phosphate isomerase-like protein (cupin superfamily)